MFSGNHFGRKIISGGITGRSSQDHAEQRQPDPGEHAGGRDPAAVAHERGSRAHVGRVGGRRRSAARRTPRTWPTGPTGRRRRSPTCRPAAAATGSSGRSARACSASASPGTAEASGPRRPWSRSSRARPSTSPPRPGTTAGSPARAGSAASRAAAAGSDGAVTVMPGAASRRASSWNGPGGARGSRPCPPGSPGRAASG